jgi:hypothetical protein
MLEEKARAIINDADIADLIFKLDHYSLKDLVNWNRSKPLGELRLELHKHLNGHLKNSRSDMDEFFKHFS